MSDLDRHGRPIVLFDGSNAEAVVAAELASLAACRDRSCVGCDYEQSCCAAQPKDINHGQ